MGIAAEIGQVKTKLGGMTDQPGERGSMFEIRSERRTTRCAEIERAA